MERWWSSSSCYSPWPICLKIFCMGNLVMLKILYGYKLLHLGLAFQLPHTILLIKEITQIEYMLLIVFTRAKLHWPCTLFSPNSLDWILEVLKLITVVSWCCNSHLLWVNASTTGRKSSSLHCHQVTELLYYTKILSLFT